MSGYDYDKVAHKASFYFTIFPNTLYVIYTGIWTYRRIG